MRWLAIAGCVLFSLLVLQCGTDTTTTREPASSVDDAFSGSVSIDLGANPNGFCPTCGGDWVDPASAAWAGGSFAFQDPPHVGWVARLTVEIWFASCDFTADVFINNIRMGTITRGVTTPGTTPACTCGTCDSQVMSLSSSLHQGFPGYVENGTNTLRIVPTFGRMAPQRAVVSTFGYDIATMSLVASKSSYVCSELFTLTATVTAGGQPLTGNVIFRPGQPYTGPPLGGPNTLVNGQATFHDLATVGQTTWWATYDPQFASYSRTIASVVVSGTLAPTTMTFTSSPNPSKLGESVTLAADVRVEPPATRSADAQISFVDSYVGRPLSIAVVPVASGHASFTTSDLGLGVHPMTADYYGSYCFAPAQASLTHNVVAEAVPTMNLTCSETPCTPSSTLSGTFANAPANAGAWVALATAGSSDDTDLAWQFTGGAPDGAVNFPSVPPGSYVGRLYADDGFTKIAESGPLVVGRSVAVAALTVTCSASPCTPEDTVTVTFANMPGYTTDWIGLVAAGQPSTQYAQFAYTHGAINGTVAFAGLPGSTTLVARAFAQNSYEQIGADSAPIVIAAASVPAVVTASCETAPCTGGLVVLSYSAMPRHARAWVSIAEPGSPDTTDVAWSYTGAASSGTRTFGAIAPGTYVARAYADDGFTKIAESAAFVVSP